MTNSPRGILGGGGDWSSARDGVPFFLKLDDGEGVLQRSSGLSKLLLGFNCSERRRNLAHDSDG
jgi:hypothetical protein